ncbi:hypothetical protein C6501_12045 [Candidatus Poribacteria bacterium]|nr:MAG: hypothetical protein C6501_12045 [Candidatus Poribacteria bacterium]
MTPEQIAQIEKIVERVLQEHLRNTQQSEEQLLAIFGATQLPLEPVLQQFQTCLQEGWKIRIILSELATKTVNLEPIYSTFGEDNVLLENDLTDISSFVENYSQIVLPALSYPMAGKLALKLVDTPCTYLVYHALCCGKRVIAASDVSSTKKSIDKKSLTLDQIEPAHVNALTEFGVKWVTVDQIAAAIRDGNVLNRVSVETPVISANVIDHLAADVQELVYAKPAIVTPLAREQAQKRGIKLTHKS